MATQIVIDTNVFISALKSKKGASFKLLSLIGGGSFEINLSVPLVLEYEDVAKRSELQLSIDQILNFVYLRLSLRLIKF